ncbi:MAG: YDG domain-containing protein, partial [Prevotellaceae bacterium]|nr:YDG domain-containing protein [Prevotellaceae bacterium]
MKKNLHNTSFTMQQRTKHFLLFLVLTMASFAANAATINVDGYGGAIAITYTDATNTVVSSIILTDAAVQTPILIGRNASETINLKVDGSGNLLFRDADGDGYIPIGSYAEFQKIDTAPGGKYKQEANLDLMSVEWTPIDAFTGEFHGGNHTIANLSITSGTTGALFSRINAGGKVSLVHIVSGNVTGGSYVGSIVVYNSGIITACSNNSNITGGSSYAGGIACRNLDGGVIVACSNTGNVMGETSYIGGVTSLNRGTIIACYNTGAISGISYCGGVTGYNYGTITACYNTGNVTNGTHVGSVTGYNDGAGAVISATYWLVGTASVGVKDNSGTSNVTQFGTAGSGLPAYPDFNGSVTEWGSTYWKPYAEGEYPILSWEEDIIPTPSAAHILYVKTGGAGTGDGSSWANAYHNFADPLLAAKTNSDIHEIWVAAGTYYPMHAADGISTNDRDKAFVLVNNVKIYGGFPIDADDTNNTTIADRNWATNVTTLSGDIDGDDGNVGDHSDIHGVNAYHVIIGAGNVGAAIVDGFTISGGCPYGSGADDITVNGQSINNRYGGGIYNNNSSPTLTNLTVSGNSGINCGGIRLNNSSSIITNVEISRNNSVYSGGGLSISNGSPALTNVTIVKNNAQAGGGIYIIGGSPTLTNVTINRNTSEGSSGGIYNGSSSLTLNNTIVWGNTSWYGSTAQSNIYLNTPTCNYSLIEGLNPAGTGNLNGTTVNNPQFVDASTGDYRLQPTSPAINAGNNALYTAAGGNLTIDKDLAGNPRLFGANIDMGAYEDQTPTYTASSNPVNHTFTAADYGYDNSTMAQAFTITNTGNQTLTGVTATITDDTNSAFEISTVLSSATITTPGGTVTVSVRPKTGLAASSTTYEAKLHISGANGLSLDVPLSFTVNKKEITVVTGVTATKEYDGTADFITDLIDISVANLTGNIDGTNLTLVKTGVTGGTLGSADAGTSGNLTLSGTFALGGSAAGNYNLVAQPVVAASITKATTGFSATSPTIQILVSNISSNDIDLGTELNPLASLATGTISYTLGAFDNQATGTNDILITDPTLSGTNNATLTYTGNGQTSGTATQVITISSLNYADITAIITFEAKDRTVTTVTATAPASITYGESLGNPSASSADGSNFTYSYSGTIEGSSTYGPDATKPTLPGSYTVTATLVSATHQGSGSDAFTIGKKTLTWNSDGVANDKTYNGTNAATVQTQPTLNGIINPDDVTVTPGTVAFASVNANTSIAVTATGYGIGGTEAIFYNAPSAQPLFADAAINAKPVTITGLSADDKVYDGNTTAVISGTPDISSYLIGGDAVSVYATSAVATFDDKNVGTGKTVTFSGFTLTGNDAGNYSLSAQPASVTANITPATGALAISQGNIAYGTLLSPQIVSRTGTGTVSYQYKVQGADDATYSATPPTVVGRYTVRGQAAATLNYTAATSAPVDFAIIITNQTTPQFADHTAIEEVFG